MMSVNICHNKSCLVIKEVEKEENRVIIIPPSRAIRVRKILVAFVDDTIFISNGEKCIQRMQ